MITKITRWGNSLAVRLPSKYLKQTKFKENENLEIEIVNDQIILKAIQKKRLRMPMQELLKGMTREGVLEQYEEWGRMGKEEL
jgi:antitoxin MazE